MTYSTIHLYSVNESNLVFGKQWPLIWTVTSSTYSSQGARPSWLSSFTPIIPVITPVQQCVQEWNGIGSTRGTGHPEIPAICMCNVCVNKVDASAMLCSWCMYPEVVLSNTDKNLSIVLFVLSMMVVLVILVTFCMLRQAWLPASAASSLLLPLLLIVNSAMQCQ